MPQAIPIVFTAAASAIAGSSAVVSAIGVIGASVLGAAVQLGGALLAQAFTPKPKAAEAQSQARIGGVSAAPPYRYVYGFTRIGGYRVFAHVDGDTLYLGYLLNSRRSHQVASIEFDSRVLAWLSDAGNDIYDMTKGAQISTAPFAALARVWVGRGDQTSPPSQFVNEINDADILSSSDAWRGLTVLWLRLDYGDSRTARDRWIATPPDLRVTGFWSLLYNPALPAHDPADPSTWDWSDNAALVALDMARDRRGMNRIDDLIDLTSFINGANACDELVPLQAGGAEKRYRIGGVVEMGGQESAKMAPVLAAAGARLVDISGKLTYFPAVWRAPELVLSDIVGEQMEYSDLREGREVPNTIRTAIIAQSRAWQETEIAPLQDPAALFEDGGVVREARLDLPLVPSPPQAMRLQKIALRRARSERRLVAEFPASAYATHAADTVTLALDGFTPANGVYEVESFEPRFAEIDGGVAMTIGLSLIETDASVYAWDAAEESVFADSAEIDNTPVALAQPGPLSFASGARAVGDGSQVPQAILTFDPSPSGAVVAYQIQRRQSGGLWQDALIARDDDLDANGDVYAEIEGVSVGVSYDFRVYAVAGDGRRSSPAVLNGQTVQPPASTVTSPHSGTATSPSAGVATVAFTTPADSDVSAIRFFGSDSNSTAAAVVLTTIAAAPNQTISINDTGLSSGQDRFYWARSVDGFGGESAFSAGVAVVIQ